MSQRLPFTQAAVRRVIAAARKEGLEVAAIKPDGTIIVRPAGSPPLAPLEETQQTAKESKWAD